MENKILVMAGMILVIGFFYANLDLTGQFYAGGVRGVESFGVASRERCDIDNDKRVDWKDAAAIDRILKGNTMRGIESADLNNDGKVNLEDKEILLKECFESRREKSSLVVYGNECKKGDITCAPSGRKNTGYRGCVYDAVDGRWKWSDEIKECKRSEKCTTFVRDGNSISRCMPEFKG